MTDQAINLQLPSSLYERLVEAAEASQQPLAAVVLQSIRMGLPPGLEHVPERFRDDLKALNQLDDELLQGVTDRDLADDKAELYEQLLIKNQRGKLELNEQQMLDTLREEADLLMLRRAYASALLRWRGHRLPLLDDPQTP